MTDETRPPDVVDGSSPPAGPAQVPAHEGASDVLAEDEVVQVPAGTKELAEGAGSTYLPDVPHWDEEDEP
jgi:hypothetical protein